MIRLFLVILMTFVFNFNASAQIRFYSLDNIQIKDRIYTTTGSALIPTGKGLMLLPKRETHSYKGKYLCFSGSLTYIDADYKRDGYLEKISIVTKCTNPPMEYMQTYTPYNAALAYGSYTKGQLLYSDGATVEMISKQYRLLLKIKSIKLCSEYNSQKVTLGTNWTNAQFMANIYHWIPEQSLTWAAEYKQGKHNATDVVFQEKKKISVIEVTFTNGQKVKLQTYEDPKWYNKPAWENAKPGMLVERFKVRQITVYKLK